MRPINVFWTAVLSAVLLMAAMPTPARFLSPDPEPADQENFNRYWYANNSPYTFVDPDGRESGAFYSQDRYTMAMPELTPTQARAAVTAQAAVLLGPLAPEAAMAVMSRAPALQNAAVVVGDIAAGDAMGGASIGAAAMALKLSGSAHEMFKEARSLLANSTASAAEKVAAFDGLSARITKESGGAWSAAKDLGADGSTIYSGGGKSGGSNMMVIDANGNVFTGKMSLETLPASNIPNYEKLQRH